LTQSRATEITDGAYAEKKQRLIAALQAPGAAGIRLAKETSNLFRDRAESPQNRLDVRAFNKVIDVDVGRGVVEVEGMAPYESIARECLARGVMPAVVPQLKSITVGGAVAGCGIESSSFKYGLVHETVREMEILLGDGTTVVCTPDNEHRDLFFGFPNSYGTLGYALKLKLLAVPIKRFVKLSHVQFSDADRYFDAIRNWSARDVDFVDGVVFARDEMYLTIGEFCDDAPFTSDYTFENIYYQSIRRRDTDYLTTHDYLWRWDTDWFWCSKQFFVQNSLIRSLVGKSRLNSVTYTKIMRWNSKWKIAHYFNKALGYRVEPVIQDVEIPLDRCSAFLDYFHEAIGITPVWICPIRPYREDVEFDLYRMDPKTLYVNFGFWDVIKGRRRVPRGFYNRQIERQVAEFGGMKSLYSDSYYTPDEFWNLYNKSAYDTLKMKYDPKALLKNLYAKTVLKE
jgi:FAD/FMN-containing dehydrogenase